MATHLLLVSIGDGGGSRGARVCVCVTLLFPVRLLFFLSAFCLFVCFSCVCGRYQAHRPESRQGCRGDLKAGKVVGRPESRQGCRGDLKAGKVVGETWARHGCRGDLKAGKVVEET